MMDFEETDLGRIEISEAVIRDIAIHSYMEFLKFDPKEGQLTLILTKRSMGPRPSRLT
jgi:uncharacterized alkaline shock family protein YloU